MIARLLRLISTIATAIVVISFVLFALEKANAGSDQSVAKLEDVNQPAPSSRAEQARAKKHTKPREVIDDADDVLVKPFTGIVHSGDIWVQRGLPALFAFIAYGIILRILAGYAVRLP